VQRSSPYNPVLEPLLRVVRGNDPKGDSAQLRQIERCRVLGGFGFVAAVAVEGVVDGLHFQITKRDGAGDADLRQRAAAAGEALRQVIGADGRMIAEDRGVLDDVSQLADVAGPGVLFQHFDRFGREELLVGLQARTEATEQVFGSGCTSSGRSRRLGRRISNVLMRYIRSSRKSPPSTISGKLRCVAQTTRHRPRRRYCRLRGEFHRFRAPEELGLHRLGQLADLVEENRAAVGHFKEADAMIVGTSERAFAMAE